MDESLLDADALLSHGAFVRAVARAMLGGDADVDDVVQDTFLAALGSGPREGWAERHRHEGHDDADPVAVADRLEQGRLVAAAVTALPEHYRTALVLRYYEDLPPCRSSRRRRRDSLPRARVTAAGLPIVDAALAVVASPWR